MPSPNIALQRTSSATPLPPLSFGTLGVTRVGLVLLALACSPVAIAAPAVRLFLSTDFCTLVPCPTHPPAPTIFPAGAPFALFVVAVDATGSQVSSYFGTISVSSSDSLASLPTPIVITGGGSFSVTLRRLGSQVVSVVDNQGLTGTILLGVTPSPVGIPTLTVRGIAFLGFSLAAVGLLAVRRSAC